jgi:hypothetical protein
MRLSEVHDSYVMALDQTRQQLSNHPAAVPVVEARPERDHQQQPPGIRSWRGHGLRRDVVARGQPVGGHVYILLNCAADAGRGENLSTGQLLPGVRGSLPFYLRHGMARDD